MAELAFVGDIGGTNARFAIADLGDLTIRDFAHVATSEHETFEGAALAYFAKIGVRPRRGAIAVAGPVTQDLFRFTNCPWSFRAGALKERLGLAELLVLNDFEALALSLPLLGGGDVAQIGGAAPEPGRLKAVVGAGTGLGVGAVVPAGNTWIALPGEGGHAALAAESAEEYAILEAVRGDAPRLSAERILSGPGLEALYRAMAARAGRETACSAAQVTACGLDGSDPLAVAALEQFALWLGRFAGDIALITGARGGLYLGGGIAPRIRAKLEDGAFRAAFDAKGRLSHFVEPIPVYLIMADDAPLRGAAMRLRELV